MPDLPPIKPTEAWFVVDPRGEVLFKTGRYEKDVCIKSFTTVWRRKERQGYRCVKLLISERGGER
jgi:hypothetical protein